MADSRQKKAQTASPQKILPKLRAYPVSKATIILLFAALAIGIFEFSNPAEALISTAVCAIVAVLADAAFFYAIKKEVKFSYNALITGIILGAIFSPQAPLWQLAALSIVAIGSKYAIRHKGMPIFNPAAFAVVLAGLLFGLYGEWWAANERVLLVLAAVFLAWKLNKWALEIAFLVIWALSHWIRDFLLQGGALHLSQSFMHPVFLVPAFFMAFMLLEPKTSPMKISRQAIYGVAVGILMATTFSIPMPVDNISLSLLGGNVLKKIMDLAKI